MWVHIRHGLHVGDTYMTSMVLGNLRMIVSADSSVSEKPAGGTSVRSGIAHESEMRQY